MHRTNDENRAADGALALLLEAHHPEAVAFALRVDAPLLARMALLERAHTNALALGVSGASVRAHLGEHDAQLLLDPTLVADHQGWAASDALRWSAQGLRELAQRRQVARVRADELEDEVERLRAWEPIDLVLDDGGSFRLELHLHPRGRRAGRRAEATSSAPFSLALVEAAAA